MQRVKRLFCISLLVVTTNTIAFGCKCRLQRKSPKQAASTSTLVFAGKLVVKKESIESGPFGQATIYTYQFLPTTIWRGSKADTITLESGHSNCSVNLEAGKDYILFATPGEELSSCQRIINTHLDVESRKLNELFRKPRFQKLLAAN